MLQLSIVITGYSEEEVGTMSQIVESARMFILNNARLLERHLFAFHFHSGEPALVRTALLAYQNADGGFGNALEPDKRTATSQPVDQEVALQVLDEIGFDTPLAHQICDFLETITTAAGGVPFVLPTVRDAPRAPWWNTEDNEPPSSINPTASIAALLHKHAVQHPWLARATNFCWQQIEETTLTGGHDFLCALPFLEYVPDRARAARAFARVSAQLLTGNFIAYEPDAPGYVFTPIQYAPRPQCMVRTLFEEATIQKHLDALIHKQQMDGGWPIAWPAISPACEVEYRGVVTLGALKTLKAYNYLD